MTDPIIRFEIPIPEDEATLAQYLSLGWYRLEDPPRLKWSFGAGSPRHPGDTEVAHQSNALQLLDALLLSELERHLPMPANTADEVVEVSVMLKVRFQKEARRQRHKGTPQIASWKPVEADMVVTPACRSKIQT